MLILKDGSAKDEGEGNHFLKEEFVDRIQSRKAARVAAGSLSGATAILMLAGGTPVQAQQTEVEALRAQIAELSARLGKIEEENAAAAAAAKAKAATPPVTTKSPVVLSGLFQLHSLNYFDQDKAFPRTADTFRIRRAELRLTAPSITSRISGTVQLDFAKAVQNTAAAPLIRARDSVLQEIQISYLLNKKGTNQTQVDVGQFKIPIGYESLQSSAALPLIERSLIFSQRDPFDGSYGDQRDTGIQLRGTQGQFAYRVGVFNGFGDRQNTLAISDPKAVLAWLSYKPKGISGLEFGVSGGKGNTGNSANNGTGPRTDRDLKNAFITYKKNKLTLQGEYLTGDSQLIDNTGLRKIKGYYGSVSYLFNPKIEGVFRYDYLDTDKTLGNAAVRDLVFGANYYIKGNNAKIQTNLIFRNGGAGSPIAGLRPDRTELRTAFQIGF